MPHPCWNPSGSPHLVLGAPHSIQLRASLQLSHLPPHGQSGCSVTGLRGVLPPNARQTPTHFPGSALLFQVCLTALQALSSLKPTTGPQPPDLLPLGAHT